ncbi:hypothetical protein [Actinoplanes sp. NPDC020271]|uniref:hypothetical protein n=1 Tax=Actinoplanes sp. NPDC020271 TaxID=3363896 RepID=UPI0037B67557
MRTSQVDASRMHGWYDVTVTAGSTVAQYAGHLENGRDSIPDPGMGGLIGPRSASAAGTPVPEAEADRH